MPSKILTYTIIIVIIIVLYYLYSPSSRYDFEGSWLNGHLTIKTYSDNSVDFIDSRGRKYTSIYDPTTHSIKIPSNLHLPFSDPGTSIYFNRSYQFIYWTVPKSISLDGLASMTRTSLVLKLNDSLESNSNFDSGVKNNFSVKRTNSGLKISL